MATAQSLSAELKRRGYATLLAQNTDGWDCTIAADPQGKPVALSVYFDRGAPGIAPRAQWLPDGKTTQHKTADATDAELADAVIASLT